MKERLDVLLVRQGFAESREKAKAVIMSGCVYVNDQKEDKAGAMFDESKITLEVRGNTLKYVSRGGLKLEKAIDKFDVELTGKTCMDIGASTGGFTDCMLQNGAVKVYSVDVGHGQLAWKLRNDERVVCMEKTNFRYMKPEDINDKIDFASVDVSFISLDKILSPAHELLAPAAQMVCLIKPQFEAGKDKVGKKGVVREPEIHIEVIENVFAFTLAKGFEILHLDYSPIRGPEGNIEYLMHLQKTDIPSEDFDGAEVVAGQFKELIDSTVAAAHKKLDI
jgi:23S rRNA (cytidine1920-2'-O)/16S rRNA (cytidine1409-2'-O)-methyltransferase